MSGKLRVSQAGAKATGGSAAIVSFDPGLHFLFVHTSPLSDACLERF
jgi:hypothetical protein